MLALLRNPYVCLTVVTFEFAAKVLLKLALAFFTGSLAMRADAFTNVGDIVECFIMMFAVWISRRDADQSYPLGRGAIEHLFTVVIGLGLLTLGTNTLVSSMMGLLSRFDLIPSALVALLPATETADLMADRLPIAIGVALVSTAVSVPFAIYEIWAGRSGGYVSLESDGWEAVASTFVEFAVVVGLVFGAFGFGWMDRVAGLVVSLIVFRTAFLLLADSGRALLNAAVPAERRRQMERTLASFPGVAGVRNLVAYRVGKLVFAEAELQTPHTDPQYLVAALDRTMKAEFPNLGRLFVRTVHAPTADGGRIAIALDGPSTDVDDALIGDQLTGASRLLLLQVEGSKVLTQRLVTGGGDLGELGTQLAAAKATRVLSGGAPIADFALPQEQTLALTVRQWLDARR